MVDVLIVGVEGNIIHASLSVIVALVYLSLLFSNSIRVVDNCTRGHEGKNCYKGGHKIVEVENFGLGTAGRYSCRSYNCERNVLVRKKMA